MQESAAASGASTSLAESWQACALVMLLTAIAALGIQYPGYLNHDVAYLTWVADQVMRGAVYGRDVWDINPPLNFVIYAPAALFGRVIGFDPAIRLWTVLIAALSIACVWQTAERSIRLPVIIALGAFFALAFPREFGQREQFALLLCAPYASASTPKRGQAVLNGIMAGIGFALKPYFLIALVLVFLTRRRIRTEEWTIAATGALYAAGLVLFFQPYLTEFLPMTGASYWTHGVNSTAEIVMFAIMVPMMIALVWWPSAPQAGRSGYAMAALGFTLAVILHNKGYSYQFIPCFGFLTLYLAASLRNPRPFVRWASIILLALTALRLTLVAVPWVIDTEARRTTIPELLKAIDGADSFWVLTNYNYPAFPTAILTRTPFVGISSNNNFASAAIAIEAGAASGDAATLGRLSREQAVRELSRQPELVIVTTTWNRYAGVTTPFDGLAWFKRDERFRDLWSHYAPAGRVGSFELYRRK